MKEIYVKARAKINLNLEVVEKRKDNYHNIKSIFQKINLYDELFIRKTETNNIQIQTNVKELKQKENIIYQAYVQLKEKNKNITGVQVKLNKNIPMQAGLGGGSTDCASFILGMNQLFNLQLTKVEREEIAKSLGADVVPCFYPGTVLAKGIGEIITPIHTNVNYYIIIIKPKIVGNTKEMYQKIDAQKKQKTKDTSQEVIEALEQGQIEKLAGNLYNTFETVIEEKETIQTIKKELMRHGAIDSLMTGSGSCVYGIFKDKKTAKTAYQALRNQYQTYITISCNPRKKETKI